MLKSLLQANDIRYKLYGAILVTALVTCFFGFFGVILIILAGELAWQHYGKSSATS